MLENGMYLIDRYEILSKVGAGGMADVYKAKDHILGRIVAIKVMRAEFSEDVNFVTKFRSEAQSAAGLEHPNIVNIYDVGSENGLHFIVMEYVEGITLKTYVEKKGQLSFKEATSIAIQVARGIEAAHGKEIIHRDIKPQNIIISTEGKVKVTDFGIARAISSNTISAEVMGSVHYASPEQARNGFVDGRSDIYSLGIVMYEMVTGRVPFDGDTTVSVAIQHLQEEMVEPSAYAPELPISYEKIVLKATQKNPDRRYQTIEEFLADLRKALANPDEDFVVIAPAAVAKTRVIGGEELEAIQNSAAEADLDSENAYANTQDEDEYDEYDEYDEDEEESEDGTGFLNPKLEKAVNIALIVFAVLIVGAVIWLGVSIAGLFGNSGNSESSGVKPPVSSELETNSDTGTEGSSVVETVEMKNIVGWDVNQAKTLLEEMGLELNIIAYGEGEKDGTILEQSELAGNMVAKGTVINVVVVGDASSLVKKSVPNVLGYTQDVAKAILSAAGFMMDVDYGYSEDVEKGLICAQDPAEGEKLTEGSKVKVTISQGKAPVTIPTSEELVGQDYDVVKYILNQKGFAVETVHEYSATVPAGDVISVEKAGMTVEYGSTVIVHVSDGPEPQESQTTTESESESASGSSEEDSSDTTTGSSENDNPSVEPSEDDNNAGAGEGEATNVDHE